ncbi:MAG: hypothetical protein RIQ33_2420 [Bacteroidota bacterium]|jgi:hypothetical protein
MLKQFALLILLMLAIKYSSAQFSFQKFLTVSDTLNKKRELLVHADCVAAFSTAMIGLNYAWYANYPRSKFHFFNDIGEWQQVDKVGHCYTAFNEAYWSSNLYRWAGVSQRRSVLYGAGVGFALQLTIETLDGFSKEWGFSLGDISANTLGAGLLVGQELMWREQKIQFKFSTHKKNYGELVLNERANDLYGKTLPERFLKDYNAQTYWLSGNISSLFHVQNKFPQWLNIAVGYGADNMFGGYANQWNKGLVVRNDLTRYRQFYISPDVDFTKIKTKSKLLKSVFMFLNVVKFPAPAFEYNTLHHTKLHWLFF